MNHSDPTAEASPHCDDDVLPAPKRGSSQEGGNILREKMFSKEHDNLVFSGLFRVDFLPLPYFTAG
jgi:hypothetical protein